MRRLCVFYNKPKYKATSGKVEWFVCKECQQKLLKGDRLNMAETLVAQLKNFYD
jgi:hypothetical protein